MSSIATFWIFLVAFSFNFAAMTALAEFSRSRLERYCIARRASRLDDIFDGEAPTGVALRVWSWFLLVGLALAALPEVMDAPPPGEEVTIHWQWIVHWIGLWIGLVALEICLVRPLGKAFAEPFLYWTWPILDLMRLCLSPILRIEQSIYRGLQWLTSSSDDGENSPIEDEILAAVNEGEREGAIHENAAAMIEGLIELHEVTVEEIMTPRNDMVMLKSTATIEEARHVICECGHSRVPVYGASRDDIRGILYAKDLLPAFRGGAKSPKDLASLALRKAVYVPKNKPVDILLQEFQRGRAHIAIVLDEYSGVAGLVTIEDALEEIVGEIEDEYDEHEAPPFRWIDDGHVEVDGRIHVDELNEVMPLDLPEDNDYDTVGGFVFSMLGRIPKVGESFQTAAALFTVIEASDRTIDRIRIELSGEGEPTGAPPINSANNTTES